MLFVTKDANVFARNVVMNTKNILAYVQAKLSLLLVGISFILTQHHFLKISNKKGCIKIPSTNKMKVNSYHKAVFHFVIISSRVFILLLNQNFVKMNNSPRM